jgi:4-amino-4-deoxy-L-arabinose transferase-like glycosyltransferase
MTVTGLSRPAPPASPPAPAQDPPRSRLRSLLLGPADAPTWVRPAVLALLAATAVLYLWNLSESGYANSFYSAAVQAGTKSWKAFFFGSSDAANFITVDKPPAALWVMELSARIFGLSSWSILAPQAVEGVAAVGMVYLTVKRWFGAPAGLVAGAVLATTPVAALMFRFNNPDALLVLLLVVATYATMRAVESASTRWLVLAGVLVGFGFITKELQTFLVVPALGGVYLLAAPATLRRRVVQLAWSGLGIVVGAGWWIAAVMLTPAADRPYIGGSTDNSLWNVIFGYNGFGRLTGNETGSVGGGPTGTSGRWGATGLLRMFGTDFGSQISWLLPAALILLVVGLIWTGRSARTDRTRAGLLLWGGSLVVTALAFSLGKGIIHPYYSVALAPEIGAVVGIGSVMAWRRRDRIDARAVMAVVLAATALWSFALLRRDPSWYPWLRWVVLVTGVVAALGWAFRPSGQRWATRAVIPVALVSAFAGPLAYSVQTASTAHTGAIPSAGPAGTGGFGGGFGGGHGFGGARPGGKGGTFRGGRVGSFGGASFGGGTTASGSTAGSSGGTFGTPPTGSVPTGASPAAGGGGFGGFTPGGGFGGGAGGNLIDGSTPSAALTKTLEAGGGHYTWIAAVTDSEAASGYQLATGQPVMAIGGFNGTDPAPSLKQFETYVHEGKIHWYISSGSGFGGATSGDASQIATWVAAHYKATTVGGVTLYDLAS